MKRLPQGSFICHSDQMITVWKLPDGTKLAQGKRVPVGHVFTKIERRQYVAGLGETLPMLRWMLNVAPLVHGNPGTLIGLGPAWERLDSAWELLCLARGSIMRRHTIGGVAHWQGLGGRMAHDAPTIPTPSHRTPMQP